MKTLFIVLLLFFFCFGISSAQYSKPKTNRINPTGTKNIMAPSELSGKVIPAYLKDEGTINSKPEKERDIIPKEREKLRERLNSKPITKTKPLRESSLKREHSGINTQSLPIVLNGWFGGAMANADVSDHTMAISNNGNIIVAHNERIYFYNSAGVLQGSSTYNSFFSVSEIFTDPHVLYDSDADRFIFVIQSGLGGPFEKLKICYSLSNNPFANGFYIYTYDVLSLTGYEIDFPNIAVSSDELIVACNLDFFFNNIVFQFDKTQGYAGGSVNSIYWTGIQSANASIGNALFPLPWGQQGNYGPGIFLISTGSVSGGDSIYVWEITNNQYNSPSVMLLPRVPVPVMSPSFGSSQLGSSCILEPLPWINISGGFYLNGIIHFCYDVNDGSGYGKILYNRLNVSTMNLTSQDIAIINSDCRYASVASAGTDTSDQSVVVGFLRSDNTIYPEMRFTYFDNAMVPSPTVLVKAGDSSVCAGDRWGDYTTIQRKFNTTSNPVVWFAGGYGNASNRWSTWVAEIGPLATNIKEETRYSENITVTPNPFCNELTFTFTNNEQVLITLYDILGQQILQQTFTNSATINAEQMQVGIYFYELRNSKGRLKTGKVLKQ